MTNKIWQQYENGLQYQKQMGFNNDFPVFVDFKEGKQWPAPTKRTLNLPRPVFNIIDMFIKTKRSSILNQPVSMHYSANNIMDDDIRDTAQMGADDFSSYSKYLWEELDQDSLNAEFIDDCATLGTGILHYYFDSSVKNSNGIPFIGEIRGEVIDPLNIIFGNPQCKNVQKQPYIIIASRMRVKDVKELAKSKGLPNEKIELIKSDDNDSVYSADKHELDGKDEDKKVTLLTKYFKNNGEIYLSKCTKLVELFSNQSLTPNIDGVVKIKLYPIVAMNWKPRKKCIFGIGEAESLIPNQKAINYNIAMQLLSVQQTAWPKLITKPEALRQPVTNEPGEQLIDYGNDGNGIRYLNPPAFSVHAVQLSDKVLDTTRTVCGVPQAMTGESMGSNMAASAIIALQSQAKAPMGEIQKAYFRAIKDIGYIWVELIKGYYYQDRPITIDDTSKVFNANQYKDFDFSLKIDVGASSEYGEALSQSTLEMMLNRNDITIQQYVELAPDNVVPFREQLKEMWEEQEQQIPQEMPQDNLPVMG